MESSETIRAHAIDFFLENGADPTAGSTTEAVLFGIVGGPTPAGCVRARPDGRGVFSA